MIKFDTVTLSEKNNDLFEICSWMQNMADNQQSLRFVNYYMEMPIVSQTSVVPDRNGTFIATLPEHHVKVIAKKHKTIITINPELSLMARCQSINPVSGEVVLSDFHYIALHDEQRANARVRLPKPVNVAIETGGVNMAGMLKNISIGGCHVNLFLRTLKPGTNVTVALKMFDPATQAILKIPAAAELVRTDATKMPVDCSFRFKQYSAMDDKLGMFVNKCQRDVLQNI